MKIAAPGVDAADVQVTTQFNGAVVEMRREFKGEAASWTKQSRKTALRKVRFNPGERVTTQSHMRGVG